MSRRIVASIAVAFATLALGCKSGDPRRAVAEDFIDRLFVTIDQPAARELAVGLAAAKIDEEIRLKGDQAIDEATRQPHINYRFVQHADAGGKDPGAGGKDATSLVYELHVAPDGADAFSRRLILTLRRADGSWRVANYTLEAPPVPD
jgi:hypothetical protein